MSGACTSNTNPYRLKLDLDRMPELWRADVPGSEAHVIRADSSHPANIGYLLRHGFPKMPPKGV